MSKNIQKVEIDSQRVQGDYSVKITNTLPPLIGAIQHNDKQSTIYTRPSKYSPPFSGRSSKITKNSKISGDFSRSNIYGVVFDSESIDSYFRPIRLRKKKAFEGLKTIHFDIF